MKTQAQSETIAAVLRKLGELIPKATTTVKVCVPSADCFSRDWSEEYIYFVDPSLLETLLQEAAQEFSHNEGG